VGGFALGAGGRTAAGAASHPARAARRCAAGARRRAVPLRTPPRHAHRRPTLGARCATGRAPWLRGSTPPPATCCRTDRSLHRA